MNKLNCSIGKKYKKNGREPWSWSKFRNGFFALRDGEGWGKDITSIFNVRKFIIYALILGLIFGYGYWKGIGNKPIILGYRDFITYIERNGEQHKIEVKKGMLYFDDKRVKVSDVPQLKPYGIKIKPKFFAGIGVSGGEVGLGAELAHYFRFNLDVFGTQKAVYAGISYDIEWAEWIRNSSTGIAIGKAWQNPEDTRILWYWSIKF